MNCESIYTVSYTHLDVYKRQGWKKALFNVMTGKVNDEGSLKAYEKYEDFCRKNTNKNTEYCAELMSAAYSGYLYKRKFFDNYIDVSFENIKLIVIHDYMDYLHMRYGNREFTKEVPKDQRFNSHIIDFKMNE